MALNVSIQSAVVIAVEGIDDRICLEYLCRKWGLNNIQFISLNESPNHDVILAIINMPGFNQIVKVFGIIRDADDKFQSSQESVAGILSRLNLPIKTGYFIFPDDNNSGTLETLLSQVISSDVNRTQCVDAFLTCIENKSVNIPNHKKDKFRIYAYLSVLDEPGKRIGEAAKAGCWDHKSVVFAKLNKFLSDLSEMG